MPTTVESRASRDRVNDREIVERALKGDASAFEELVLLYGQAVYRTALAALGSPMDAEDVMQDAFIVAYRKLAHFRGDASFKTWLLTIAWRCAVRRRQSPARRLYHMVAGSEFLKICPGARRPPRTRWSREKCDSSCGG